MTFTTLDTDDSFIKRTLDATLAKARHHLTKESCGFGFVLHRRLVEAGVQSFLITPIALNGKRKTDKLDARALCVRLSR